MLNLNSAAVPIKAPDSLRNLCMLGFSAWLPGQVQDMHG